MLTKWVVWGFSGISQAVAGAPMDGNEACFLRRDRLRAIVGQNGLRTGLSIKPISAASPASRCPPRYANPMAIFHLTHRTVGRSTHAAGTAGAHISYITRSSACRAVITEHIPTAEPGSKGGAARAWLDGQEDADRKNARVIDKLEIALTDRKSPCHEGPQPRQIEAKGRPAEKLARIREARNTSGKPEQLHSARERASEREREAAWQLRAPQALDAPTRRADRVLECLRRVAEGIWQGQRDRDAARKALRASASGALGTRFLSEPVARHIED